MFPLRCEPYSLTEVTMLSCWAPPPIAATVHLNGIPGDGS